MMTYPYHKSSYEKYKSGFYLLFTGNIPIRFILKNRRINFLWYILNQNEESLLGKFFKAQCQDPVKTDWVNTVKQDLIELDMNMNFDDIKNLSKAHK